MKPLMMKSITRKSNSNALRAFQDENEGNIIILRKLQIEFESTRSLQSERNLQFQPFR